MLFTWLFQYQIIRLTEDFTSCYATEKTIPVNRSKTHSRRYEKLFFHIYLWVRSQTAFTCSKLTIEALEKGVKYVQS